MTSFRQTEANRRNARKSTGPITEEGKQRSRCNAVRHGLTAETVIGALEDAEDYKAFEAAITADYDAQSAVERELVLRLAGLLWRLRRATTMETGLFEIQADHLSGVGQARQVHPASREVVYALFGRATRAASTTIRHRTASRTKRKTCPAPCRNRSNLLSILTLSSRGVFYVLPICPITRSTASADTKQPFGAKSARSCLRLMLWIAANHRTEGAVSIWATPKICRPTSPRNLESADADERTKFYREKWVRFAKKAFSKLSTERADLAKSLASFSNRVLPGNIGLHVDWRCIPGSRLPPRSAEAAA